MRPFDDRKSAPSGRMCMHCGKPRATQVVQLGKRTFYLHAKCAEERVQLATNGRSRDDGSGFDVRKLKRYTPPGSEAISAFAIILPGKSSGE